MSQSTTLGGDMAILLVYIRGYGPSCRARFSLLYRKKTKRIPQRPASSKVIAGTTLRHPPSRQVRHRSQTAPCPTVLGIRAKQCRGYYL